jgi:hypothetical protein
LIALSSCFSHVSPLSIVIPRYLTSLDSWIILLKRIGSLSPFMVLFLVKGMTTVLFGLIDDFVFSRHCWTVHRAVCKTSDTVMRIFLLIRIAVSSAYPSVESPKKIIHDQAPQQRRQHTSLRTPSGCRRPQGLSRQCSTYIPAFQHSTDPSAYSGLNTMPFRSLFYCRFRKCSRVHTKQKRTASVLMFIRRYHKDDEFLNHIVRVTGDDTWESLAVKAVDAHTSTKQADRV